MECNICGSEKHAACSCPVAIAERQSIALERIADALEKLASVTTEIVGAVMAEIAKGD